MLKKVVVIARHGPRNPIMSLHKLDQSVWEDLKTKNEDHIAERATLTKNGREFCKEFGKILKKQYYDKLLLDKDSNLREVVEFYSSKIHRTQDSAILVAKEFCGIHVDKHELLFDESISADPNIRYKHGGIENFKKLAKEIKIDDKHIEMSIKLKNFINEHLADIETNNHFFDVRGTLECYHFENIPLPSVVNKEILKQIEICAMSYYKNLIKHPHMHCIATDIEKFIKSLLLNNDSKKFVYISTHDSIIFPLSQHINPSYSKLPNFCSHIKYELFDDNIVDVYYDDTKISSFILD